MKRSEVQEVVKAELSDLVDSPGDRRKILQRISAVENALGVHTETRYWASKPAERHIHRLQEALSQSPLTGLRPVIDSERRALLNQISDESTERASIQTDLKSILTADQQKVLRTSLAEDFVQRAAAVGDQTKRNRLRDEYVDKLNDLRQRLLSSSFNHTKASTVFNGSRDDVRKYAASFAWHLETRGWNREDIEEVGESFAKTSDPLDDFIRTVSQQQQHTFRVLTFIESISLTGGAQSFPNGRWTLYPRDSLNLNHFPSSRTLTDPTNQHFIQNYAAIDFEVKAFGKREADKKAAERIAELLDASALREPNKDLIEPRHRNRWPRVVWDIDAGTEHSQLSLSNHLSATFDPSDIVDIAELLTLAGTGPAHGTGVQLSSTTAGAAAAAQVGSGQSSTPLQRCFARGLHFYRRGMLPGPSIDTIIDQIACLETLVSEGRSWRDTIISKSLILAGTHETRKEDTTTALQELYVLRNTALHSGYLAATSQPRIDWAQTKSRVHLARILSNMASYLDDRQGSDLSALLAYQGRYLACRYRALHWALSNDGVTLDTDYQLTGALRKQDGTHFADTTGQLRVTDHPDQSILVTVNLTLSNRSRPMIDHATQLTLHGSFNGVQWELGPMNPWKFVTGNDHTQYFSEFTSP
jgi:hypothetical protein